MRTCIKEGMIPCTRCCEVIGISHKGFFHKLNSGRVVYVTGDLMRDYWTKVSKRRAKKINKYAVSSFPKGTEWFTCKKLSKEGCTVQENKPSACNAFSASVDYSESCPTDSRTFFRTKDL